MLLDSLDEGQRAALRRLQRAQLAEARRIRQAVADGYGVPVAQLQAAGRAREVSEARQVAMHAMRLRLRWPLATRNVPFPFERIGALLGERDHSTIMHGVAAIAARLGGDADGDGCLRHTVRSIHTTLDATYEGDAGRHAA
jgi:chromosomal replication initiation ATPase DnaA